MDGIIIINKEKGCTSHDVVYKIKKIFGEKVGHTGTLDPMATGVLPILIGKGTLCSKYLMNHDKKYKVKLQLGEKTTTADTEGEIIEENQVDSTIFNKNILEETLNSFIGKQKQIPPIYSAIKVKGKKLYEYAREGKEVKIEPRDIEIYNITLLDFDSELKQIDFEVSCSKGTYIRSLCEDIALKLGTLGYMKELQRLQVGQFCLKDAVTVEEVEQFCSKDDVKIEGIGHKFVLTIENLFEDKEQIVLSDKVLRLFLNGVKLNAFKPNGAYRIYNNCNFIGIGVVENNFLKRDVIIKMFS